MNERNVVLAGEMDAFLVEPDGTGEGPGVVVIPEAYGVNHAIQEACRRLAREGFVALAPEIYHRTGRHLDLPYDFPKVMPHFGALTNEGLSDDLDSAARALVDHDRVDAGKIAAVGFCVGGFGAFLAALRPIYSAAVAFYGGGLVRERPNIQLKPLLARADELRCPVLALFGADDTSIPASDVEEIRRTLASRSTENEVVVYPGAPHAFANPDRPSYRAEAADDAWRRTLHFLRSVMR